MIPPVLLLLMQRDPLGIIIASDSVLGVGLITLVFRDRFKNENVSNEFGIAALLTVLYGLLRFYLFNELHVQLFNETLQTIQKDMPMLANAISPESVSILKNLLPSGWIVFQLIALFIGFILMRRNLGFQFNLRRFRLPVFLSYLLIAVIPMYFVKQAWFPFVNCLIGLSFIYLFQGLGVMISKLMQYITNPVIFIVLIVFIVINALSYIVLIVLGLADQWLDFRQIETNGGTHQ